MPYSRWARGIRAPTGAAVPEPDFRPLLDRIDIQIEVRAFPYRELATQAPGESSLALRERIGSARQRQLARFHGRPLFRNAQIPARDLARYCPVDPAAERLLHHAMDRLVLSARAYTRISKVARSIADLAECELITSAHIAEAVQYRSLDRAPHNEWFGVELSIRPFCPS